MTSDFNVILVDVNHYRVNELQAADRILEQIIRYDLGESRWRGNMNLSLTEKMFANIIGIFTLDFHNQHDCHELKCLLQDLGIGINQVIPEGGSVRNIYQL